MTRPLKALELFAGIGGFAAAAGERATIVGAIDISKHVLEVYGMNNDHATHQLNLATLEAKDLAPFEADFWWMSPPCQPYTVRGHQKDLEDHRAASLVNLLGIIEELLPKNLAMENVQGFYDSEARQKLLGTLESNGYEVRERLLCTTELGVPAKRERYYMTASREGLEAVGEPLRAERTRISDYLIEEPDEALFISRAVLDKHGPGMRIVDIEDDEAITNCFTSAYGKTYRYSGSYFRHPDGRVRYADPNELLALLHFPLPFHFPDSVTRKRRYKYIGNSLSVIAMREILRAFPAFS
ncbi:MAG: DNA cytosine methyltransferase [Myxococcota bacterium]|jgi:DNA (cytosine-5)-methyltransferase 1/tRNA (cytosine38-C5)-methyltransferase|nr:DNA cytosine methyltransferase [Myxococcota bacterium]